MAGTIFGNHPCEVNSLGGHFVLGDSAQEVAAAEWGDLLGEVLVVEADPVVPHHHAVRVASKDDDLQLKSRRGRQGGEKLAARRGGRKQETGNS